MHRTEQVSRVIVAPKSLSLVIWCQKYSTLSTGLNAGLQVLLFSTMTRALDVIEDYLQWRGWSWLRLDGGTSSADRGDLVNDFNSPGIDQGSVLKGVDHSISCERPRCPHLWRHHVGCILLQCLT